MNGDRRAGFTLVELVLAVALLGLVAVPLSMALSLAFRTEGETTDRFTGSVGAQLTMLYFVPDVQSASYIDTIQSTLPSAPNSCAQSGDSVVLRLGWTETPTTGATTATMQTYVRRGSGTAAELLRLSCTGASLSALGAPARTTVLASGVTAATVPACSGACSARLLTLNVTEQTPSQAAASPPGGYSFSITARRRPA